MEQRAIDRANRVPEEENVLAKLPADIRRSVAKRLQKPVRAPVKDD
ncbi:hypothetical protein CEV34_2683 [Brucella pseudogrignonensis]|uniref:Uncharacterized protein n=2 Tax=Brucella pseudogrignonensis TaxID=419475 RepID=A0A256GFI6_9HYPH|nr:hypothetical protein CEV34_2683 [Brucella pseudogrignonensis]